MKFYCIRSQGNHDFTSLCAGKDACGKSGEGPCYTRGYAALFGVWAKPFLNDWRGYPTIVSLESHSQFTIHLSLTLGHGIALLGLCVVSCWVRLRVERSSIEEGSKKYFGTPLPCSMGVYELALLKVPALTTAVGPPCRRHNRISGFVRAGALMHRCRVRDKQKTPCLLPRTSEND